MANAKLRPSVREIVARLTKVRRAQKEYFFVFSLDAKGRVTTQEVVTLVHPREVFYAAIRRRAVAIIVAHNHPSGDVTPTDEDKRLTYRLGNAGFILGIELLDHIIVAEAGHTSLRKKGVMD